MKKNNRKQNKNRKNSSAKNAASKSGKTKKLVKKKKRSAPLPPPKPKEITIEKVDKFDRYDDVYREWQTDEVVSAERNKRQFTFTCKGGVQMRIEVLSAQIIRFRYGIGGIWPTDFSYAIDKKFRPSRTNIDFEVEDLYYLIETEALSILVNKQNGKVNIYNEKGKLIAQDGKGFYAKTSIHRGIQEVAHFRKAPKKEQYLGLGDKSGRLNLRGRTLENWVTDAFCYGETTDPLYRAIPFYYCLNKSEAYGIFFDNSYRSFFDFDSKRKRTVKMSANGGEMNYYFIYGPDLTTIAQQYTRLTGKPELPPKWALGFHQCRWSYYPEKRVRELARTFRKLKIPCDAIYLDIDYMDGYRCFTWNKKYFPRPKKMIGDLARKGFQTVVMIDPGLKTDDQYWVYQSGLKKDVFCKRPDGSLMRGPVWPSDCVFPDFTDPKARVWWGGLYKELYKELGVSGFWNDMNEPAVFLVNSKTFPEDVRHHYDGLDVSHKRAHNVYGMQMSRASYEGFKKLLPRKRPFLLTRATYSGGQRYAAVWTGDNVATWNHLRIANRQCQRLSISGFSLVGTDVGGFAERPDGELMVRWLQLAAFHPLYRVHSIGNNVDGSTEVEGEMVAEQEATERIDQEPWAFGDHYTDLARQAIELRYRLMGYLYSAFRQHCTDGTPVIRPLSFYDQTDANACNTQRDFLFGNSLLVSPVVRKGRSRQRIYFPKGRWYDFFTGLPYKGGKKRSIRVGLSDVPVFAKAGAVIPVYPVQQYTNQLNFKQITLHVYFVNGSAKTEFYEDVGEGYAYAKGDYSLRIFVCQGENSQLKLTQRIKGSYRRGYSRLEVKLFGLPFIPERAEVDGKTVKIDALAEDQGFGYGAVVGAEFGDLVIW